MVRPPFRLYFRFNFSFEQRLIRSEIYLQDSTFSLIVYVLRHRDECLRVYGEEADDKDIE